MKFSVYSPAASPSLDQQRDALQKGLGRSVQWSLRGCLDEALLLQVCLRDQRFDQQVEDPRGAWLCQMMGALGATERFRVPILHALYDLAGNRTEAQLCQLAKHYAAAGDESFRARLYEIVEQKPVIDSPWLGEEEIINLDGEQGFLFAARVRGLRLKDQGWHWEDSSLAHLAIEQLGEERVGALLAGSSDDAVKNFRDSWQVQKEKEAEQKLQASHSDRMRATPVAEAIQAAETDGPCFWLRGWGLHAREGDLRLVLKKLWTAREPGVIANLLKVFSARKLPEFDARLIDLCRHDNENVQERALKALEQNTHPLVRKFALSRIENRVRDGAVVALFIRNYARGDELRIFEAMELPDDKCERHWLLMDAIKVLENNSDADCSQLGLMAYAETPCEQCRRDAAQLMLNQNVAPEWLRAECLFDSSAKCRKVAAEFNDSAESP